MGKTTLTNQAQAAGVKPARNRYVLLFAAVVAVQLLLAAYFVARTGFVDELGLYNPSYMFAHTGQLTYPIYGNFNSIITIHPPIHVGCIGLLAKLGFTWYYAEATPTFLWLLLVIVVVVRAPFSTPVQLGFLFSIATALETTGNGMVLFGTRPEGHVLGAWLAGLVLLESGRLQHWRKTMLFGGAFAMSWAAGTHYYAVASVGGVVFYMIYAIHDLGFRKAVRPMAALAGGACLFGVPYLAIFLVPNWEAIHAGIQNSQGDGAIIPSSIGLHFAQIRVFARAWPEPLYLRWAFACGLPLLVFSTVAMVAFRRTRLIAMAALPLQLFIFLFAAHKVGTYLIHEIVIFGAALCITILIAYEHLVSRFAEKLRRAAIPAAVVFLCVFVTWNSHAMEAVVAEWPRVHEADVARAAVRDLIRDPVVVGPLSLWYASGASEWSQQWGRHPYHDVPGAIRFYSSFDAAAQGAYNSVETEEPDLSITSLFAGGTLKLRGFYFGDTDAELQFVLLHPDPRGPIAGYAAKGKHLFRFDQQDGGAYQVVSAVCPEMPGTAVGNWRVRWNQTPSAVLYLPKGRADHADSVVTFMSRLTDAEPAGEIAQSCREIARIRGSLQEVDRNRLIDRLRRTDQTIVFDRSEADNLRYLQQLEKPHLY